jgi:hemolysin activation/secretion protein
LRAVYTPGLYDLITPGLVVFADHGTAWLEDERDFRWSQVRGAVGAGLRLGFNRGSADLPIRIDLAWPVFYPAEQSAPVLSIGTRHLF